ncbi:MAG: VOC family protein [Sphingobium sp.]|jgi:predicted enzyme related to lactoylglutathione lyase|nr:VOC family protein [Sphingobium sp.]MCI1270464.1 VOC family protein [Sphingobium sp.]MCI1756451.1 VOC family protein [Sphingobium sp.]MCI2051852.1 VOC family protein [Sphingobium sp.]
MRARINYLELTSASTGRSKAFYTAAFGWDFTDFGPDYSATTSDDTDLGLTGEVDAESAPVLPVIEVTGLEVVREIIIAQGGQVVKPIFAFPGGRRFHFRDPDGHVLGAWERVEHG